MSDITDVVAALKAYAPLQALIGNGDSPLTVRVYPIIARQGADAPYVVYRTIVGSEPQVLRPNANGNTQNLRVRMTSWADTLADANAVAKQVNKAMLLATAFKATRVMFLDDFDVDTRQYGYIADYSVWLT